jgi:hypothetical protein
MRRSHLEKAKKNVHTKSHATGNEGEHLLGRPAIYHRRRQASSSTAARRASS